MFAVVDLYGKCAAVALMDNSSQEARIVSNELSNEATAAAREEIQYVFAVAVEGSRRNLVLNHSAHVDQYGHFRSLY